MIVFYVVRYIQDEFYEVGELYFLNSLLSRVTNFNVVINLRLLNL